MLQLDLSHYNYVYITIKGTVTAQGQIIEIKKVGFYYLKTILYLLGAYQISMAY